jgi:two-component system invasion response regulator UvrY
MDKIKILIVEDHSLLRETWTVIINQDPRFFVVGSCGTGEAAIEFLNHTVPQVIMMDINLPGINGYDASREILEKFPDIKILAISLHNSPQYAKEMMQLGAKGYISKNASTEELFTALQELSIGNKYLSTEIKNKIADSLFDKEENKGNHLSEREM